MKNSIELKNIKDLLANNFQKAILKKNLSNEKQFNTALYEFLKFNLPSYVSIKREIKTKHGVIDILIDNMYILELKYADNIGTLDKGIAEIIRYKNLNKYVLLIILYNNTLKRSVIKKYEKYYRQTNTDVIILNSRSIRKKNRSIETVIRKKFSGRKFFTSKDALNLFDSDKNIINVTLSRLEKQGTIERVEKGKYIIIPPNAEKGKYTLHEFIIGSLLVKPYAISYWSALNFYGFTEQIPTTVFMQTTSRKKRQEKIIFGVKYKIVRIKGEKFFGIRTERIEESEISITTKEKTIIDCLDKPQYCGGIIEAVKAFRNGKLDMDRKILKEYAIRINNGAVIRRLGYICDRFKIKMKLPEPNTRNYVYLDPTMPKEGKKNAKWRIIINVEEYDLLND